MNYAVSEKPSERASEDPSLYAPDGNRLSYIYVRGTTYQIQFRSPKSPKPIQASLGTSDRAVALQLQREIDAGLKRLFVEAGHQPPPSRLPGPASAHTIFALRERYQLWAEINIARGTWYQRDNALAAWQSIVGIEDLRRITPDDVEHFKRHLSESCVPRTVNDRVKALRIVVNQAIKMHWYAGPNPFAGIQKLRVQETPVPWIKSRADIDRLLAAAWAHSFEGLAFTVQCLFAGMRRRESCHARWEWYDWAAGTVTIQASAGFNTKSGRFRVVPLHRDLIALLKPHAQPSGFVIHPERTAWAGAVRYDHRATFGTIAVNAGFFKLVARPSERPPGERPASEGPSWERESPDSRPSRLRKVPTINAKLLRHTFASQLVSAGVSLYKVQELLGHADAKTTQIYAHLQKRPEDVNVF